MNYWATGFWATNYWSSDYWPVYEAIVDGFMVASFKVTFHPSAKSTLS